LINFHNVKWKNLLSTGNAWTVIQLDRSPTTLITGNNGAGKSTLLDALCFVLFGKAYRKINKNQLINTINGKKLEIEIEFSIGTKTYKVVRGIKPNKFEIYIDGEQMDEEASVRDTQQYFEQNILRMNYTSFTQMVILGSSTFTPFMQLTAGARRELIEDLLDLKVFSVMNGLLKERMSALETKISKSNDTLSNKNDYARLLQNHIQKIEESRKQEQKDNQEQLNVLYEEIDELNKNIAECQEKIGDWEGRLGDKGELERKLSEIATMMTKLKMKRKSLQDEVNFFENNDVCPTCTQPITQETIDEKIGKKKETVDEIIAALEQLSDKYSKQNYKLAVILEVESNIRDEQMNLNKYVAQKEGKESVIKNLSIKQEGTRINTTSEKEDLSKTQDEIADLEEKLKELHSFKSVFTAAGLLLKDKAIKAKIIKEYIPVINDKVNEYLGLLDFFVEFEIDEEFNEVIRSRHRDDFSYESFSEGEKMRIDLALLLTWRAVAKAKNSMNTNLLILDEVFDASMDNNGCEEFLKLIDELSSDTNILVISHKGEVIQDKFRSNITFTKNKNFSEIAA